MKISTLSILITILHSASAFVLKSARRVASSSTTRYMSNADDKDDDDTWIDKRDEKQQDSKRRDLMYNAIALGLIGASGVANAYTPSGFQRISPAKFIAALGDPKASQGSGASEWGLWKVDPGPRGVWLNDYTKQITSNNNNMAPAGWTFDRNDWWLEEHGLIMEAPQFPLEAGRYLVTGGRMVTTELTIDLKGNWKLEEGSLYDVTHLPCRSARYTPGPQEEKGSPLTANPRDFPVAPGAIMPSVPGCDKQDYAVLFVVGKAV
jgi:hypothetical protein